MFTLLYTVGKVLKHWTGKVDAPPYINTTNLNLTDIQYWFESIRGANSVKIKIFNDTAMAAIDRDLVSFATDVRGSDNVTLRKLVRVHNKRQRWTQNSRMFFLRHAAFSMSDIGGRSYTGYTYWREDNYFLSPLDISGIDFNKHTRPYVIVDNSCEFGSYSDKMYVTNWEGAELLFDGSRTDFLEKMKKWVLFAKVQRTDPFQTERFLHDTLSAAVVERRVLMRVDVRYQNGLLCIPKLYHDCLSKSLQVAVASAGLLPS